MLRVWKTEIFDKFKCVMGACPSNCCDEDWQITIDDDTYDAFRKMNFPNLGEFISDSQPHLLIKKNHKCPFITPEGLCMIHRDLGEDFLSETCRSYPRFVSEYGDIFTETVGASCPEVARMLVTLNHSLNIKSETFYENASEKGKKIPELESEKVLKSVLIYFEGKIGLFDAFERAGEGFGETEDLRQRDFESILKGLWDEAKGVGGLEIYDELKLGDVTVSADDLNRINDELFSKYRYLAVNICRNYLFEHIMYNENLDVKDYASTVRKAELLIIIFYCALLAGGNEELSQDYVIDRLYKTMRLVDHSESVLSDLLKI